jgi:Flp pilus assembly protein TadG
MRKEDRLRASSKHSRERGSVMIMFTLMLPVIIMLVGLAVDRTMVFIVESRLSSAVDGAALGAGRLLGTPANTTEIAQEFLNANFPSGYWGSYNLTPTITSTTNIALHTITVSANVTVPLLFLRVFNQPTTVVGATAQATRQDARIILVLDRSGSMAGDPLTSMVQGAESFVTAFNPASDELGLVVFGSTAVVAYPPLPRPYTSATNAGGGPDSNYTTEQTGGDITDQLNALAAGGATNMSEALSLAYIELQKSYNRDVAANGSDNRLNSIVLFTDGMPTGFSVYANSPNSPPGNVINGGSNNCTNKTATGTNTTQMIGGVFVSSGNGVPGANTAGLVALATAYNDSTSTLTWMARTNDYTYAINPSTPITGCNNLKNKDTGSDLADFTQIPPYDLYKNSTTDAGYTNSWLYSQYATAYTPTATSISCGRSCTHTAAQDAYQLAIAGWNAIDNAGNTVRSQTAMNTIYIYTIGYEGDGGTDQGLLNRLANTQSSTSYNAAQPVGQFVDASTTTDLVAAFETVAGAILRLAK